MTLSTIDRDVLIEIKDLVKHFPVRGGLLQRIVGAVHAVKTVSRPAVTVSTGGMGNPIVSIIEDGVAIVVSILAIILPILAVIVFVCLGFFVYWSYKKVRVLVSRTRPPQVNTPSTS